VGAQKHTTTHCNICNTLQRTPGARRGKYEQADTKGAAQHEALRNIF